MESINPYDGALLRRFEPMTRAEAEQAVALAAQAQSVWRAQGMDARAERMRALAAALRGGAERHARLAAQEMGKPIREARTEIEKCAFTAEFYAGHGAHFLADEEVKTDASRAFVTFQPLGVVLAIMPWNFPFWQVFRCAIPALMAGNACVLKHASNVQGCAAAIEELFREAGFPEHLFRALRVTRADTEAVIRHKLVRAVSLTGGTEAGRAVAASAGAALKKTVLELGGNDAYVILADADIGKAAAAIAKGRLLNAGQSCIAAKRVIAVDSAHDAFVEALTAQFAKAIMGDPLDERTDIGPLASAAQRDALHRQVTESVKKGARCVLGGKLPEGKGAFYPPTILTGVAKEMPAFDEELFGPVASISRARDEAEALALANDSPYGLGGGIFTEDLEKGLRLAREAFDSGACFLNSCTRSDPRLPFGGVRDSGHGRELSYFGIREFVNIKAVSVA